MSNQTAELHQLMKRAETEGALMPREDRSRLVSLLSRLMPDRY